MKSKRVALGLTSATELGFAPVNLRVVSKASTSFLEARNLRKSWPTKLEGSNLRKGKTKQGKRKEERRRRKWLAHAGGKSQKRGDEMRK